MSSNIKINKVCENCSEVFIAKTTKTRYCSHKCNSTHYKIKAREAKLNEVPILQQKTKKIYDLSEINKKEFLTVKEASIILSMSLRTVYRLIEDGDLNAYNFSIRKTLIRRKDIDSYFDFNLTKTKVDKKNQDNMITIENSYTLQEVYKKYNISEGALYNVIKRLDIPKKKHGKFVLVKKEDIDKIFAEND